MAERESPGLAGWNVLVVEDEYFLAMEMADAVRRAGGVVLGPVPEADEALRIVRAERVDAAVLDIRLGTQTSFPVAVELKGRGVPAVFVSGNEIASLPDALRDLPVHRKPVDADAVLACLAALGRRTGAERDAAHASSSD